MASSPGVNESILNEPVPLLRVARSALVAPSGTIIVCESMVDDGKATLGLVSVKRTV